MLPQGWQALMAGVAAEKADGTTDTVETLSFLPS